ncbi:cobalamin biosynthesis protein [Rheinheimera sp.]|uniref:cobalamin biosynthesis protein CobD/CbiB n=1 Tax=Rheinheimera sp. TaxID=1869214 RepID=UPI0027B9B364|nr:cobalamin biosynthesis protein [Rheinheimera sp.]
MDWSALPLNDFLQMLQQPVLQQPLLALLMIALSAVFPLPPSYQPLQVVRQAAIGLAKRVNKPGYGKQQLFISGSLAMLVLLLPLLALAAAFASLSEWPEFWHALLLYCCLDWQNQRNQAFLLAQSIEKQQLSLARDLIKPLVLRQSQQLSEVGLCKASIESLTLRLAKQWVGVLFWFLVGGGLAAFAYRLLLELQQSWNPKQPGFTEFGQPVSRFMVLLAWLPQLLTGALLALLKNWRGSRYYRDLAKNSDYALPQRWLLAASSAALQCNLAGPRYYDHHKQRRIRFGPKAEPTAQDIRHFLQISRQLQHAVVLLIASGWLVLMVALSPL